MVPPTPKRMMWRVTETPCRILQRSFGVCVHKNGSVVRLSVEWTSGLYDFLADLMECKEDNSV
jgi:hypothetical protein